MNDNLKKPTAENAFSTPIVKDIFSVSADFLGQFRTWLEQNPPAIPVSQIVGFNQFTAQAATMIQPATNESTASTTNVDLTTVGPTLTGLSDGQYLILFGCLFKSSSTTFGANMTVQVNSTAATVDNDDLSTLTTTFLPGMYVITKTLANGGNNTLTAKYRAGGGATATFRRRWMVALRFAN